MINPFVNFRDCLEEKILDVEEMQLPIKIILGLLESENKLKTKLKVLQEDLTKGNIGWINFFKSLLIIKTCAIAPNPIVWQVRWNALKPSMAEQPKKDIDESPIPIGIPIANDDGRSNFGPRK